MALIIRRFVIGLLPTLTLTACVHDPIYDWRSKTQSTYKVQVTMSEALQHLYKARDGYHSAIQEQLRSESSVNRALIIGSGALLTAAGLKAHSDVLLTGGALTGTIYGLGSSELSRARITAYLTGIEALNCVESSIAAIRIVDLTALKPRVNLLNTKSLELEEAIKNLRFEYDASGGKATGGADLLVDSGLTLKAARTVVLSTGAFLAKHEIAAYELYAQVEKVDRSVTQAVVTSTPNLAQAKDIANGIGVNINSLVSKAVSDANATRTASAAPAAVAQSDNKSETSFSKARNAVILSQNQVRAIIAEINLLLPSSFESHNTESMKACGLAPIPALFMADSKDLNFVAKKRQTASVSFTGGLKEYVVGSNDLPSGLTFSPPGKDGSTLYVSLDDRVEIKTGRYEIRVHDQTPGGNVIVLPVNVSPAENSPVATGKIPAQKPTPPAVKKPNNNPSVAAQEEDVKRILSLKTIEVDGKQFSLMAAEIEAGKPITVSVCGPVNEINKNNLSAAIQLKAKVKKSLEFKTNSICL